MSLKNNLFEFDKVKKTNCANANEIASVDSQCRQPKSKSRNDVFLIGTDEAGRGPGAGGVFASAVYFPNATPDLIEQLSDLNDSKKISKKVREELFEIIIKNSVHSTVCIEVEEIEKINILNASLKAMKLACENVMNEVKSEKEKVKSILVLVDGNKLIKDFASSTVQPFDLSTTIHQKCIVKGDSKSASIAAASILAKVSRDRYMQELDAKFPQYCWKNNAGYLTKQHLKAIDEFGLSPIHRKTFLRKHFERNKQLEFTL